MRIGARGELWPLVGVLLAALSACGQSKRSQDGGSAGTGGNSVGCAEHLSAEDWLDETPPPLPARLEGTLCDADDALTIAFDNSLVDQPISVQLSEGSGDYSLVLYGKYEEALYPLEEAHRPEVLAFDAAAPTLFFSAGTYGLDDNRVIVSLVGSPGRVAVDFTRPELPPHSNCSGSYESLPAELPPLGLPALLEGELCNSRDSKVWAVEVAAGRPVTITLDDPEAADWLDVVLAENASPFRELTVSTGETRVTLGLLAERRMVFTPAASGVIAILASLGYSREGGFGLRVEQP